MADKIEQTVTPENLHIHVGYMRADITEIKATLKKDYVTQEEFEPIKRVVYGIAALIFVTVGAAVLNVVLK